MGRYREGLEALDKALTIDRKINSRWAIAYDLRNKALVHLRMGEPQKALPLLEEALELAGAIGNRINEAKVLLGFGALQDSRRMDIDYRLDGTFDHWLLDEFQDTSTIQWMALRELLGEVLQDESGRRTLFYVGDVKQAIYGWRGGDAGIRHRCGGGRRRLGRWPGGIQRPVFPHRAPGRILQDDAEVQQPRPHPVGEVVLPGGAQVRPQVHQ